MFLSNNLMLEYKVEIIKNKVIWVNFRFFQGIAAGSSRWQPGGEVVNIEIVDTLLEANMLIERWRPAIPGQHR